MPRAKRPPPSLEGRNRRRRRQTSTATEAPPPAAAAAAVVAGGGDLLRAFGRCRALLEILLQHGDGWVFKAPVDTRALDLRDYYTVVRDPMDLGTVLRRLERRRYADPHEFAADVRLTFRNAMSYNNRGDPVYKMAAELSKIFEAGWAPFLASLPPLPPTDAECKASSLRDGLPQMPVGAPQSAAAVLQARPACVGEKKLKVEIDLDQADAAALGELDRLVAEHRSTGRGRRGCRLQDP